ncbi:MAG: AbrB/MazE/SpoVT family DNA-binding domain-containing protein [Deltaproteobacteria bacterium]|nr:AbrB/MazE/SpoVT family DNA-binding domain-containing protein [Deltaproteobacteria bacterium]
MKTKAQKWGNSLSVRVPKGIAEKAGIRDEDMLDIDIENGKIILIPIKKKEYQLKDLLKKITDENIHGEIDFGEPLGREIF